jgi:hypothetical protein
LARANILKNAFRSGEVCPEFYGQTDRPEYAQAVKVMQNMITGAAGGAIQRTGSIKVDKRDDINVGEVAGSYIKGQLIPFTVSKLEAYVILFYVGSGGHTIKIYNVSTGAVLGVGSGITLNGGLTEASNLVYFALYGALNRRTHYAQSADVMLVTCGVTQQIRIKRTAANTFTIEPWDYASAFPDTNARVKAIPFRDINATSTTMAISNVAVGVGRTLTISSAIKLGNGAYVKITNNSVTGVAKVTAGGGAAVTSVTVDVIVAFDAGCTVGKTAWYQSAWDDTNGWPKAVTWYGSRLIFSGTESYPDTHWASETFNYLRFMREILAQWAATELQTGEAAAMQFTPTALEVNAVQWLAPARALFSGSLGEEFMIANPDGSTSIGPTSIDMPSQSNWGSTAVRPARVGDSIVHVDRSGRGLRRMVFDNDRASYRSFDLLRYAKHLLKIGIPSSGITTNPTEIINVAFQSTDSVLWVNDSNGRLFGVTVDDEGNISAPHRHTIGGTYGTGAAVVHSVCAVPSKNGTGMDVWLFVLRDIAGVPTGFVEYIASESEATKVFNASTDIKDKHIYVDCAMFKRPGGTRTTFSGFGDLEGEQLDVVADGRYVGKKTVVAGDIVLDKLATEVIAGYGYRAYVQPLLPDEGSRVGSSQGLVKRIDHIGVHFVDTISAKHGPSLDQLSDFLFRDQTQTAQNLEDSRFTGLKVVEFEGDYTETPDVFIVNDLPFPMKISQLSTRLQVYE